MDTDPNPDLFWSFLRFKRGRGVGQEGEDRAVGKPGGICGDDGTL